MKRYEGEPITPGGAGNHPWAHYCHFWVSDWPLAAAMNRRLDTLLRGDLSRWREAVAAVLTVPSESGWKLILFDEGENLTR